MRECKGERQRECKGERQRASVELILMSNLRDGSRLELCLEDTSG